MLTFSNQNKFTELNKFLKCSE